MTTPTNIGDTPITTPPIMDEAAKAAAQLNMGEVDPAERERLFQYRAQPALDLFGKQQETTNKYFEAQGLRFGSERRGDLLDLTEKTFKGIGESVMVPQIEREQADRRANIGLAAGIGETQFGQTMQVAQFGEQQRQFDIGAGQQQAQFAAQLGLSTQQFEEARRQFNVGTAQQQEQFAASLGMTKEQLAEGMRQFNVSAAQQAAQFGASMGEQQRQFNLQAEQQAGQFAAQLGLSTQQFQETARQFNVGNETQKAQFAAQLGVTKDQLAETIRQFDIGIASEETRYFAGLAMQETQIEETRRQFNESLATTKDQFASQFGLSTQQFEEGRRQFDAATDAQKDQFAQQLGLTREQLAETIRQYDDSLVQRQEEFDRAQTLAERSQAALEKLQKGQLDIAERQMSMSETNAAMERAQRRGEMTGVFTDPDSGLSMDTLAKNALLFGQNIDERQTVVLETNAALARAQLRGEQTGLYYDKITGMDLETLQARKLGLDRDIARATAIGRWIETLDVPEGDIWNTLDALGIDPNLFLGEGEAPPAPPPGGAAPPLAETAQEYARRVIREATFAQTLPGWSTRLNDVSVQALETITAGLGIEAATQLFTLLESGGSFSVTDFSQMPPDVFMAIADMVTTDLLPDGSNVATAKVHLAGGGGTSTATSATPVTPPAALAAMQTYPRNSWNHYTVMALAGGLDAGTVTREQINALPIQQSWKDHIFSFAAGGPRGT